MKLYNRNNGNAEDKLDNARWRKNSRIPSDRENDESINVWLSQIIGSHTFGIFYENNNVFGDVKPCIVVKSEEAGSTLVPNVGKFQQDIAAQCNFRTQASVSL